MDGRVRKQPILDELTKTNLHGTPVEPGVPAIPVIPARCSTMANGRPVPSKRPEDHQSMAIAMPLSRMSSEKPLDLPIAPTGGIPSESILHLERYPCAGGQHEGPVEQLILKPVYLAESKLLVICHQEAKHLGLELICRARSAGLHIGRHP